jgi:hypothetical protein
MSVLRIEKKDEDIIRRQIDDYKALEKIETEGLSPITPILNVTDKEICYYEKPCSVLKLVSNKGYKSLQEDHLATLIISDQNIHIVGSGHNRIKNKDVITVSMPSKDGTLEFILKSRKTPFYLKVNDPMSVMAMVTMAANK